MPALLKVWIDAKTIDDANKVARRVTERCAGAELSAVERYHKGGFEARFEVSVLSGARAELVYELLRKAQTFARGWTLSGRIEEEADLFSRDVLISGATAAHLVLPPEQPNQHSPTGTNSNLSFRCLRVSRHEELFFTRRVWIQL